jgi:2-amino-4-hydroxy-6-hydroxymethyldihydropteridine diphosphokinase
VTRAFLSLGSNVGDRCAHLERALESLAHTPDVRVVAISHVYETRPVGGPLQDDYLNAVVAIEVSMGPEDLLRLAHDLERDAARVRAERWGPRTLDVDILLYGDVSVDTPELTIPHPRMWERGFVLAPLRDVAPELVPSDAAWEGVRVATVELKLPWSDNNGPLP